MSEIQTFTHLHHKNEVFNMGTLFSRLELVFQVITVFANTCMRSNTPLSFSWFYDFLVKAKPLFRQHSA